MHRNALTLCWEPKDAPTREVLFITESLLPLSNLRWTQSFTTNEKAVLEQNFRDLVRDLEKQKEEVRAALEQREQDAVDQIKVIVDALDERAKVLQEDKQTREQLHSISDSVLFLQVISNSSAI